MSEMVDLADGDGELTASSKTLPVTMVRLSGDTAAESRPDQL